MKRCLTTATILALAATLSAGPELGWAQSAGTWLTFHGSSLRNGLTAASGPTTDFVANQWQLPKAPGSSPAIDANGVAYIGAGDGKIYALDPASPAKPKWSFATKGPVWSGPTLSPDGKTLYVGSDDDTVYALETATGKKVWSSPERGSVRSSPLLSSDGSTLYVSDTTGNVQALKTSDGSSVWGPFSFSPGGAIPGSLAMSPDGTTLYAATYSSILFGFPTGGPQGAQGSQATAYYLDGPAASTPAIDTNGNIYVTTARGSIMSFAPGSNGVRWTFVVPDLQPSYSTPAVGSGLVIFGDTNGTLYALNASNKDIAWTAHTGGPISSSPAIAGNGMVFVGAGDDNIYAYNTSGTLVWSKGTGAPISSSPAVGPDGSLWVGSENGFVFRFQPASGLPGPPGPPGSPSGPKATPTPSASATPTSVGVSPTGNLVLVLKPKVKAGQRQVITAKTTPSTLIRFRIQYPNGDHQSGHVTSDAAGNATYSYKQGPSKIQHNRFYATVAGRIGAGSSQSSATAQYRIMYGKIDVSAEPRTQRVGGTVNIYIHASPRTRVAAYLMFPKGRISRLQGRTGPKGWAHLRYKVARGRTSGKNRRVVVMAKPTSGRPNISTKTYFTIR